ncbi:MAG: hypothetical protein WED27_09895, partial [Pirellulales bacterium]
MTYREAIREALREALAADHRVFLMGEDVGRYGGAYACSRGLLEEFGLERVELLSRVVFRGSESGGVLQ